jgi:hypothetical protein
MTDEQIAATSIEMGKVAAPIYAHYLTMPMKRTEAMELAVREAVVLMGAAEAFLREHL